MASVCPITPAPAQQPGLPAFIVCDRVPEGCIAYLVPDNSHAPLLRAGEWVIVDPSDREPVSGELFVIQWSRGGPQVVEVDMMPRRSQVDGGPLWIAGARHRGFNAKVLGFGSPGQIVGDFPYRSGQMTERFLGKVVGLLEPAFSEPLRLAQAA